MPFSPSRFFIMKIFADMTLSSSLQKDRLPRKMFLSVPPPEAEIQAPADLHETFHPLGIAVTVSNPYFLDTQDDSVASKGEPPALLVLVANHPRPHSAGVIDVFVHDLDQFGGKDCNILRWIKRIEGSELESAEEGQEVATRINPYRIGVFEEQHSQSMPRAYPLPSHAYDASAIAEGKGEEDRAKSMVRIPSIFIVSLPDPDANNVVKEADSAVVPSYMQFVASLLRPAKSKKITGAPTKLYIHHSSVQQTMPAQMDGALIQSWKGFPPLLQVWDGNGVRGGSNTSASSLFLSSVDTEHSGVLEWEQHWVRGIPSGIKQHLVSLDGKGEPSMVVNTYTPSFVNFFDQKADYPVRALAIDRLGRFWTAGNRDTLAAEAWIESQRNEARRRTGSSLYQKQDAYPARPEVLIDQTTFLFRHMGRVAAHPWEFSKLAGLKKKGIFLRKEYHTFPVFRSAPETKDEIEVRSKYDTLARGFLPSVPTGMAVDHEKGIVFVTGAYEDRGVAKCTIPEAWAEK